MKAIFNKEIFNDQKLILNVDDRAIQYGDGIFETIIIRDGTPDLLDYHYQRLKEGAKALGFNLPDYFTKQNLKTSILQLIKVNKLNSPVRIKVQVWRSSGGFYEPHSYSSNVLLTIRKHSDQKTVLKNVGILSSVKNYLSPYSQFKTSNALKYILGSIEKQKSNYDDMIILDSKSTQPQGETFNIPDEGTDEITEPKAEDSKKKEKAKNTKNTDKDTKVEKEKKGKAEKVDEEDNDDIPF